MPRILTRSRKIIPVSGGGGGGGSNALIIGPYGQLDGLIGIGPGGNQAAPRYGLAGFNPHQSSNLNADILAGQTLGIQMLALVCDAPPTFGAGTTSSPGVFNMTAYTNNLDAIHANSNFNDAVAAGDIWLYGGDEPGHAKWGGTWTPTLVRDCFREIKLRWPLSYTFIRWEPTKMLAGWNGNPRPAGADPYDKIDYACMQYEGPQARANKTALQAINDERAAGNQINLGTWATLNLWAGGLMMQSVSGVPVCWDYDENGTTSGVVVGAVAQPLFTPGQKVSCAPWNAIVGTRSTTVASPAWVHAFIDNCYNDPDLPFLGLWTYASSGLVSWALPYQNRPTFQAELDYMILKGSQRVQFNGLRPRK